MSGQQPGPVQPSVTVGMPLPSISGYLPHTIDAASSGTLYRGIAPVARGSCASSGSSPLATPLSLPSSPPSSFKSEAALLPPEPTLAMPVAAAGAAPEPLADAEADADADELAGCADTASPCFSWPEAGSFAALAPSPACSPPPSFPAPALALLFGLGFGAIGSDETAGAWGARADRTQQARQGDVEKQQQSRTQR